MGTVLRQQGHEVRLIPAQFVQNDFLDAEAIAEAVTQQNMRFVQIKNQEQLDGQAMHRVRDRLGQGGTALINELRGLLLERGITFAAQPIHRRKNLRAVIEDAEQNLTPRLRWRLNRVWEEGKQTEVEIKARTEEMERISNEDARGRQPVRFPASVHWFRLPPWPPSEMAVPSDEDATLPLGSGWCRDRVPPEASRSCSA